MGDMEEISTSAETSTSVETVVERRRSARYLGKERISYSLKRPASATKKLSVLKRYKMNHEKRVSDPSMQNIEAVDGNHVNGANGSVKSAEIRVKETLRLFNTHYLHFVQEEEKRVTNRKVSKDLNPKSKQKNGKKTEDSISKSPATTKHKGYKNTVGGKDEVKQSAKRPDLKAISKMIESGTILYPEKRFGHLPGIDVGHQFFSRAEMVVLGVHSHWLNGIDYMGLPYAKMEEYKDYPFPLAICIVLSGMYEDDVDNSEIITYTGQGGHDLLGSKQQVRDQKMERGNLALKNNFLCGVPVRVVRGHKSKNSYTGKVYTYDGLYKVIRCWPESGKSKYTVYKYNLKRVEGQPSLTTEQVRSIGEEVPQSVSDVKGLVCEDISNGQENFPIPATNEVDDPAFAPTDFEYCKSIRLSKNLKLPTDVMGCKCEGECVDASTCSCARLNGSDFPYVRKDGGRLIEAKSVVFECGPTCGCKPSCVNRTSQQGLKYRLEVFRTSFKGWAVRSWDTIPPGAPICEYTGILKRTDEIDTTSENNYIFEIDCLQTMKGLDGRERRPGDAILLANCDGTKTEVAEYCIDAGTVGGIARFINHSCQPNLFVQCILSSHHDVRLAKVMLFAADLILPLQELTYDYGYTLDSVVGADGKVIQKPCYCGAANCRKRLH